MGQHTKTLGLVSGILLGGMLYFRLGSSPFGWEWYQAELFLSPIGLAAVFPTARLSALGGLILAPVLATIAQLVVGIYRDPGCCNLWPIGLVVSFIIILPATLIGGLTSHFLGRARLPQSIYLLPLLLSLIIPALFPYIERTRQNHLQTETIPRLMNDIYRSEMAYSAGRPDRGFACDGKQLPGTGDLGWGHVAGDTINNLLFGRHYTVKLECQNDANPRSFRLTAFSNAKVHGHIFFIDPSGKLTIDPSGTLAESAHSAEASPSTRLTTASGKDSVQLASASPKPGTRVPRGQPFTFNVAVDYTLASVDRAILSLSVAQVPAPANDCSEENHLTDHVEVPITRGKGHLDLTVTWSGDTGTGTGGRIDGTGYVGFWPMLWVDRNGARGDRLMLSAVDAHYCYPFGP